MAVGKVGIAQAIQIGAAQCGRAGGLKGSETVDDPPGLAKGDMVLLNPPLEAGTVQSANGSAPAVPEADTGNPRPGASAPETTAAEAPARSEGGERQPRPPRQQRAPRETVAPAAPAGAGGA